MMRYFGLVSVIWLRMWKSYTFIAAAAFVLTLCSSAVLAQSYLSISDFSTSEGNSGTTNFDFTVSLSPPSSETVTVEYRDIWYGGSSPAETPEDYVATSGTLTFNPGTTIQIITVQVKGDTKVEDDEEFGVWIEDPTNASFLSVLDQLGTGIIENDDLPILSIAEVTATEGDNGIKEFSFSVTLSEPSSQTVTVEYSTDDDSATVPEDYVATSGTLTFSPGTTIQTIIVQVNGDTDVEEDEAFIVSLENPINAILSPIIFAKGTIENDDLPVLSISNVIAAEGNSGVTDFKFAVILSEPSSETITVEYSTDDDSAAAPEDYISASGTLTFSPGMTSQMITVQVRGDTKAEVDEYFELWLDNVTNAILVNNWAVGTIQNDDVETIPTLEIIDVTSVEGSTGTNEFRFEVILSNPTSEIVTVHYLTQDDSATSPNDYVAISGLLIFDPSITTQTISVQVNGDSDVEADETFNVILYDPSNAIISDDLAVGMIQDDDTPGGQRNIIYVDPDAPNPNDGRSWSTAFWCLQNALEVANNGDEIRVAEGIYKPDQRVVVDGRQGSQIIASGDREATFQLINGIILKGGYAGFGHENPDTRDVEKYRSILSGDLAGNDIGMNDPYTVVTDQRKSDNSYHVVRNSGNDTTAVLDGFTIASGTATALNPNDDQHDKGGGMLNQGGNPTIINCTFYGNVAIIGGGMFNQNHTQPTLIDCTFFQNIAINEGGGMHDDKNNNIDSTLIRCVFKGNWCAGKGGGINTYNNTITMDSCTFNENISEENGGGTYCRGGIASVDNCEFRNNSADNNGGGLLLDGINIATLTNCIFLENSAQDGGGLKISGNSSNITITDCVFHKNTASEGGGGYAGGGGIQLNNCTFTENSAKTGGGAVAGNSSLSSMILYGLTRFSNCIFRDNSALQDGGGLRDSGCELTDCTFEGNRADDGAGVQASTSISRVYTNCTLNYNIAASRGGAFHIDNEDNLILNHCTISHNSAGSGGGLYLRNNCNPMLNYCTISSNIAQDQGGGAYMDATNTTIFANCQIISNSAHKGAGIFTINHSKPILSHCIVNGNIASGEGGGIYNEGSTTTLENCSLTGNTAQKGAAIYTQSEDLLTNCLLTNCTLVANIAEDLGGGIYSSRGNITLTNNILWSNRVGIDEPDSSSQLLSENSIINHCCIQGWIGSGRYDSNINSDPMFVREPYDGGDGWADDLNTPNINEAANNDYGVLWLQPESSCINAGDSTALPVDTLDLDGDGDFAEPIPFDLDGAPRILGDAVDIGAYEHHKELVIHVDDDASGANNGTNWQNAYNHLQDALAHAESVVKPVVILVADGVYYPDQGLNKTPGDRTATFNLINWVTLRGGYAGFNKPDPNLRDTDIHKSILSGDLDWNDIPVTNLSLLLNESTRSENSYHVITADGIDSTAVLNGFTITAGNASDFGDYSKGGGFYIDNSNPTISNCTLISNSATEGAGIYNRQSSPTLEGCIFQGNAALNGAGLFNNFSSPNLTVCDFKTNFAKENGGAVYNNNQSAPELTQCVFMDNKADQQGGAIHNDNSNPILKDCTIIKNMANYNGGGICNIVSSPTVIECKITKNSAELGGGIYNDQSTPNVTNCIFNQNVAEERGGGIFNSFVSSPVVTNCRFGQNRAGLRGGGLHNHASSASVNNCTFTDNSADWEGGGICNVESKLTLSNCILWGNSAESWAQLRSYGTTVNLTVSHCVIQDGLPIDMVNQVSSTTSDGNLDINPNLTADYHIQLGSPCIDAGNNNSIPTDSADLDDDQNVIEPIPIDTDADSRFVDDPNMDDTGTGTAPIVDIGADEFFDSDDDHLPDWWEEKHFGDSNIAEPDADPDGDTLTNLQEYELYSSNPIAPPLYVDSKGILRTIQDGIDAANDGDTVLVVAGIYTGEGNRDIDFRGKSVVLKSLDGPEVTIIDCEGLARGFNFHSGEGPSAAIVGIRITHGQADYGGAIYCERSHPQLRNCIIENNNDPNHEIGGIYGYLSNPALTDCVIIDNAGSGIHIKHGSIRISGSIQIYSDKWSGQDIMLYGDGTLEISSDSIMSLDNSRIRCTILGAGTIKVGLNSYLFVEKDAVVDLGLEEKKGQIECNGLLRVKDKAQIINANINITRASFEGDVNISNSVITAEAGAPYGQFFIEDSVTILGNEIHADGDRYMDMDRSVFYGLIENNRIYVLITEGVDQTRGGLLELRGQDGLVSDADSLNEFLYKVDPDTIPAFDPNSWTLEELNLADGAKLNLTNRFDFQAPYDSGGKEEVLYVKDIILGEESVLNTAFNRIYYENLYLADTAIIKNVPLLGFSLNMIYLDDYIEFITRVTNNNFENPLNPEFNRIHVAHITGSEPDPDGMMRMRNLLELNPDSPRYGEVINARAKGLFAKANEEKVLVLFDYLFETSEPGTELVVYLSDVPELLANDNPSRYNHYIEVAPDIPKLLANDGSSRPDHYIEVARIPAPPPGRPGSAGSGRFGMFRKTISAGHLDFVRGVRIEFELLGSNGASVLINDWDPQVNCYGICMDFNWDNFVDTGDLMVVIRNYGLPGDGPGNVCLNGALSDDGYIDLHDVSSWDWTLNLDSRLNLCGDIPLSSEAVFLNTGSSRQSLSGGKMGLMDLSSNPEGLLIMGKRGGNANNVLTTKLEDRLYILDHQGKYLDKFELTVNRGNTKLVMDPGGELYQLSYEEGLLQLIGGESVLPSGRLSYAQEPRHEMTATVSIGLQGEGADLWGRPVMDAAFDLDGYLYVVPVVVHPVGEETYLAAAKLQLQNDQIPPYNLIRLYDDPPLPGDNQQRNSLREIEVDNKGNVYVTNSHHLNESDILWIFDSTTGVMKDRLDLVAPYSDVNIPAPAALCASKYDSQLYLASTRNQPNATSTIVYCLSTETLRLERMITIEGMGHITSITENPDTGLIWVAGFTMSDIPDYPNPFDPPFYHPYLAKIPYGSNGPVQAISLSTASDLALPISILWAGSPTEDVVADLSLQGNRNRRIADMIAIVDLVQKWLNP